MRAVWLILPLLLALDEPPQAASDAQLVDLSECEIRWPPREPVYRPEWMRHVEGEGIELYVLPLEVRILSVDPKGPPCYKRPSVLVDMSITNRGAGPYMLPVSRDSRLTIKPENRRRTTFQINLELRGADDRTHAGTSIVETYAAANVPDSYRMLDPGESRRVRVSVRLRDAVEMFLKKGQPAENLSRMVIGVYEYIGREQPGLRESAADGAVHSKDTVPSVQILH